MQISRQGAVTWEDRSIEVWLENAWEKPDKSMDANQAEFGCLWLANYVNDAENLLRDTTKEGRKVALLQQELSGETVSQKYAQTPVGA